MDETEKLESLYDPAAPQYQTRAEKQRNLIQQFEADALDRDRRRQEYIRRYSYNFDLDTFDAFSNAAKNAENPADEMHELLAAASVSRLFGVPMEEARANSDYYRNLLYPNVERYRNPKSWEEGARDSFKLGTNGMALDYYGFQLMAAEMNGTSKEGIYEKMNEIEAENERLAANMPTAWYNRLLQFGAQMTPYTGALIGVGALVAF
jgi:hypothetical protein